ncbi:orotate phosphoribosyltransferase-like protein [Methanococcoides sp. FTZ1]|uniref:orotate phosphoribosyltransferase-like protein n=1 Tax=Methanococcoides sp. FTZ1 TaxID=3439061 RepID=UPI003F84A7CD
MNNIEEMIQKAVELQANGLVTGQIANELNVSRETVTWLLTRSKKDVVPPAPKDISVNWSSIGQNSFRLKCVSQALCDMVAESLETTDETAEVVIGIGLSGIPIATIMAEELDLEFAVFHDYDDKKDKSQRGIFSRNFADVRGKNCIIVDDVVSSGATIRDVIEQLREVEANPVAIAVILDKMNSDSIANVPMSSLVRITRVD